MVGGGGDILAILVPYKGLPVSPIFLPSRFALVPVPPCSNSRLSKILEAPDILSINFLFLT